MALATYTIAGRAVTRLDTADTVVVVSSVVFASLFEIAWTLYDEMWIYSGYC